MRFWVREIAGWLFVGLGLFAFYLVYDMVMAARYFECAPLLLLGIILFRGGIHLLRVALAARVCADVRFQPAQPVRVAVAVPGKPFPGRNAPLGQT
jgi:hypothetical protein